MDIFSKIKNFFKQHKTNTKKVKIKRNISIFSSRNKNHSISAFNTNTIPIPKYNSLSEEEKVLCDSFYNEIDYKKYKSILNYGIHLIKQVDSTSKIIIKILDELRNQNPSYNVVRFKDDIVSLSEHSGTNDILTLELIIAKGILEKVRKETFLRATALDRFIKKESIRTLDFLGAFGKDERLLYLTFKNSLNEAMQRILISIPTIEFQISALEQTIASEESLRTSTKIYKEAFERLNGQISTSSFSESINRLASRIIDQSDLLFEEKEDYEALKINLSDIYNRIQSLEKNPEKQDFTNELHLEDLKAKTILANIKYKIDSYVLSHQKEKEIFMANIDSIINQGLGHNIKYLKNIIPLFYKRLCIIKRVLYSSSLDIDEEALFSKYSLLLNPLFCEEYDWYMSMTENSSKLKKYNVVLPEGHKQDIVKAYMTKKVPEILKVRYHYDEDSELLVKEHSKYEVNDIMILSFRDMFLYHLDSWNIFKNENLLFSNLISIQTKKADSALDDYLSDLYGKTTISDVVQLYGLEGLVLKGKGEKCSIIDIFEYIIFSNSFIFDKNSKLGTEIFYSNDRVKEMNSQYDTYKIIKQNIEDIFPEITSAYSYIFFEALITILYKEFNRIFNFEYKPQDYIQSCYSDCDVAYFPKMVKGLYSVSKQRYDGTTLARHIDFLRLINTPSYDEIILELPKCIFNNNTKAIFLHDEFDISNFYRLLPYLPKLEYVVISSNKFEQINNQDPDKLISFNDRLLSGVSLKIQESNPPKGEWTEEKKQFFNDIKKYISNLVLLVVDQNDDKKFYKCGIPKKLKLLKQGFTIQIG